MALPQTAVQIEMMMQAYRKRQVGMIDVMRRLYFPPLFELLAKRLFLQRPRTDDMMQMCVDLGVEVPDRQRISFDGLTIDLRR